MNRNARRPTTSDGTIALAEEAADIPRAKITRPLPAAAAIFETRDVIDVSRIIYHGRKVS